MFDKEGDTKYASLAPDGTWRRFNGVRYYYEPVELVAPTLEALADYAQELRDQAPDIEGSCAFPRFVNSGLYMTTGRQYVLEMILLVAPRGIEDPVQSSHCGTNPRHQDEIPSRVPGPLPSMKWVVMNWVQWFLDLDLGPKLR